MSDHVRLLDAERDGQTRGSPVADTPTPLRWRPVLVLLFLTAMQPLAFEIVFPFVNQMILEIGVVTDPEQVGFYSGLIESIFSCMSFIAILPSTYLADRIGRKPVVLGGILGLAISVASFGVSESFPAMVLSRCIAGALGGAWVCTKVMLGEQTDRSNQGLAFQSMTMAYRTGQIIGLPLGGLLAHPERNFPPFRTNFWYRYPFALPCFVASALALCSVAMGYFFLQETLTHKQTKSIGGEPTYGTMSPQDDHVASSPAAPERISTAKCGPSKRTDKSSLGSILTPPIISLLVSNVAMCLSSEALFSLFPLFAFTPISSGGLGMSEAAIGTQMAVRALLQILLMGAFLPLQRRLGTVRLYQLTMWTAPPTMLCLPLLNFIARQGHETTWPFNLALSVFFFLWCFNGFAWTSISIMVTNASPSPDALAKINSLSQMAVVLPQAIAPASVTSLFAVSIKTDIAGGNLIYIILLAFTCAGAIHSTTLREPA